MAETNNVAEDRGAEQVRGRLDPELRIMGAMLRLLDELESDGARIRAVGWLSDRYHHDRLPQSMR